LPKAPRAPQNNTADGPNDQITATGCVIANAVNAAVDDATAPATSATPASTTL